MSDPGDIFDLFSQGDDEKKQRKAQDGESQGQSNDTDIKSLIINKITRNKVLLIIVIFIALLFSGVAAYFFIGYISNHGAGAIIDTVKPFIK